jgi:hypothetical protein
MNREVPNAIVGRWAGIVKDVGFGTRVLFLEFHQTGTYSMAWIGPLPSHDIGAGSQPVLGEVFEGTVAIQGNILRFHSAAGSALQSYTFSVQEGVLVLVYDEHRIYQLMKLVSPEAR